MRKYGLFQTGKQKIIVKTKTELKKNDATKKTKSKIGDGRKKEAAINPISCS